MALNLDKSSQSARPLGFSLGQRCAIHLFFRSVVCVRGCVRALIIFCLFCMCICTLWRPNGNFPMGNSGRFPEGKPTAAESRYPSLLNHTVHAGSFRVSIIHRTLTWTTRSLTCVRDHSCACVYTHGGWAHRQRVSTIF